ncbi:MAG: PfkB family carbohydrate kinase [Sedimentisphaeraceae bacterium JB056]
MLLVTGSIGIDTVETPFGKSEDCLGGSAIYFSLAASNFSDVRFLGVVGEDCPFDLEEVFDGRKVDLTGLEYRKGSRTFRWHGSYAGSMNDAQTHLTELNVLGEQPAVFPESYTDSEYVFLANTHPSIQISLLDKLENCKFSAADTMNLWIDTTNDELKEMISRIDMLFINDSEARLLTGKYNLVSACEDILDMGPQVVVLKKGENGVFMAEKEGSYFALPAFPTSHVKDPTGAGDSFAGGVMGYIANAGNTDISIIRNALAFGTACASFTISEFSTLGLQKADMKLIEARVEMLRSFISF